jgi:hypothetical protein
MEHNNNAPHEQQNLHDQIAGECRVKVEEAKAHAKGKLPRLLRMPQMLPVIPKEDKFSDIKSEREILFAKRISGKELSEYRAEYRARKNGEGTCTLADGSSRKDKSKDGKFHGQETSTDKDRTKYLVKRNDEGRIKYANVDLHKSELKNCQFYAQHTLTVKEVKEVSEHLAKKNGEGTCTLADGSSSKGEFKDGNIVVKPKNKLKPVQVEAVENNLLEELLSH